MPDNNRIDTIVMILFAVVALVVPAAVIMRHFFGIDPLALLHIGWGRTVIGVIFALLATAVTGLNVFLTIIAPWSHHRRHGSMDDYSNISGLPLIGGFFIFCAGALLPSSISVGIFLLVIYTLDTGGLPWFLYAVLIEGD
jgi:membrane protease YdiL (CAAX protease family)